MGRSDRMFTARYRRRCAQRKQNHSQLKIIFAIMAMTLVLHLSFACLLLFNDYVADNWIHTKLQFAPEGDYVHWIWWMYVYIPISLFVYGLYELYPLLRLYFGRHTLCGAQIRLLPTIVNSIFIMNSVGILLLISGCAMVVALEDKFVSHMIVLVFWGIYMRIGPAIGSRA